MLFCHLLSSQFFGFIMVDVPRWIVSLIVCLIVSLFVQRGSCFSQKRVSGCNDRTPEISEPDPFQNAAEQIIKFAESKRHVAQTEKVKRTPIKALGVQSQ